MREQPTLGAGSPSTSSPGTATGSVSTPPRSDTAFNESMAKLFDPEFMAEQDTEAALEGGRWVRTTPIGASSTSRPTASSPT